MEFVDIMYSSIVINIEFIGYIRKVANKFVEEVGLNMKEALYLRKARLRDVPIVCRLIIDSFNLFIGEGYSDEGKEEFYRFVNPLSVEERMKEDNQMIVAQVKEDIVGVIDRRSISHISLFFVDENYLRHGIGKKLLNRAIESIRNTDSEVEYITVNSSPYALEIYRRLGFETTSDEQVVNGIRFIPMRMKINN